MHIHRNILLVLVLLLAVPSLRAADVGFQLQPVTSKAAFDSLYASSLEAFRSAEYQRAAAGFKALVLSPGRRSEYLDNCYYWLGECRYAEQSWLDALTLFSKVLEFPRPGKEEAARLKIALCWQNLKEPGRACDEARALLERYPDGEFASRARKMQERSCPD